MGNWDNPWDINMKKDAAKNIFAALAIIGCFHFAIGPASAHRVNVFAWVEGDTVYVESKFPGGKKVRAGRILVTDMQGNELLSGLTNDAGEFSFKVPKRSDLKIVLIAGQGHQAEWLIRASEMEDMPSKTAPATGAGEVMHREEAKSVSETSVDARTAVPGTNFNSQELEAVLETVLDRKLKPIARILADIRQEGPTVKDILAGIGYIFGLVGIVAYIQSRKKKK
jgi:nickel transport protein